MRNVNQALDVAVGTQRYGCHVTVSDALLKCAAELQLHRSQEHDLVAIGALGTKHTIPTFCMNCSGKSCLRIQAQI